jgi:hypothetical protein
MVSVTEARQELEELERLVDRVASKASYHDVRMLESSITRCLGLMQRLTGNEDMRAGIQTIQKTIMALRTIQAAYHAVMLARMAAGDPIAWFNAATTAAYAVATVAEVASY